MRPVAIKPPGSLTSRSDQEMKSHHIILFIIMLAATGCTSPDKANSEDKPMSIIALPDARDQSTIKEYVKLQLPYGIIISNGDTNSPASYYLFCRAKRSILKTTNVDAFLAELEDLQDGITVDMVSKCTVPFYTQYGVNIDQQYKRIFETIKRKRFKLLTSLEDDVRHTSFCYCETGFIVLDKAK